jgi:menaquinone-9 beta-reductase
MYMQGKVIHLKPIQETQIAIIGGGLAGLALAIQSAKAGYAVTLFEKENYPQHKVCGEYISLESWDFLQSLGLPLSTMQLPIIKHFQVSDVKGKIFSANLPLGGFGVSRYQLDEMLYALALQAGVQVHTQTKVNDVQFVNDQFLLDTTKGKFEAKIVAGSFGKRSNLDVKWNRSFVLQKQNKLNNYIGVKYHIQFAHPKDLIALHNFENGYCGISKVENDVCCLCYLTTAENLQKSNNNIQQMEKEILSSNPQLKNIFANATFLFAKPVTIAQISFDKKEQVMDHMLMLGDAAGMITPLCGNGMSMALHGSKIAFQNMDAFLQGKINRQTMETQFQQQWNKQFAQRLKVGRAVQSMFGSNARTSFLIRMMKLFPFLAKPLIKMTHGKSF